VSKPILEPVPFSPIFKSALGGGLILVVWQMAGSGFGDDFGYFLRQWTALISALHY